MEKKMFRISILSATVVLGIEVGGLEFTVFKIAREFGMGSGAAGSLMSVYYAASAVAPLAAGGLSDRFGKKRMLLLSLLICLAGTLICLSGSTFLLIAVGVFCMGAAFGCIDTVTTAALSDFDSKNAAARISSMQGILSIMCFAAPLLLQLLIRCTSAGYRMLFLLGAGVSAAAALITAKAEYPAGNAGGQGGDSNSMKEILAGFWSVVDRNMLLLLGAVFCYMFIEGGFASMIDYYMTTCARLPQWSAAALGAFWLGMGVVRLLSRFYSRYEKQVLLAGFLLAGALLLLLPHVRTAVLLVILHGALGAVCAPIWPFLAGALNRDYPRATGVMSSAVLLAGGLGSAISPSLFGFLIRLYGYPAGRWILILSAAAGFLLCTAAARLRAKREF